MKLTQERGDIEDQTRNHSPFDVVLKFEKEATIPTGSSVSDFFCAGGTRTKTLVSKKF